MAGFPSFLRINNIPMYVCIYLCIFNNLLIYLSTDGHLGCCCILAVVNNAAVNMKMQISLQDSDFISFPLYIYPEVGLLNPTFLRNFVFMRNFHAVFHSSCANLYFH